MANRRRYLVAVSLTVHLAFVLALFVAGFWRIDKLDSPRHRFEVTVQARPEPAPEGGPSRNQPEKFKPKTPKVNPNVLTQPEVLPKVAEKPTEAALVPGNGSGSGSGSGIGSGSAKSKGDCTEDCGDEAVPKKIAKRVTAEPKLVPPSVLKEIRIEGKTQIQPSDVEKTALIRSGKTQAHASVMVCVGDDGNVMSLALRNQSGYPGWDSAILAAMRDWRYKPYLVNGKPVAVCSVVNYTFEIR